MLMHVSPDEVSGLQALGQMTGHKLHTNPHTGLPEAFGFADFFTSFLPTIAGIAAAPATGGFSMAPILAGAGTGALLAAAKGDDPLMGGLTGGFGGYGGGNLAGSFGKMSTAGSNAITNKVATDAAYSGSLGGMQGVAGGATQAGSTSFGAGLTPGASGAIANPMAVNAAAPSFGQNMLSQAGTNLGNTYSGLGELVKDPVAAYGRFTDAGGTAGQLATPVGGAVLAGLEPSDLGYSEEGFMKDPDTGKWRGPEGQLNLSDKFDTGLRLVAKGGYIDGYALGGAVNTNPSVGAGLSDLYNRPEGATAQNISSDGYGIGRLNNLANEQSRYQAQTLGYAMGGLTALKSGGQPGGYLDGQGDGMSDSIPATIEGKQPARLADGEFVIPADVVSHLGNGSSKAGSKRLYAMLDKVRHARTGNKKQGKEINPAKYMPA
jgi:hypothetical protein